MNISQLKLRRDKFDDVDSDDDDDNDDNNNNNNNNNKEYWKSKKLETNDLSAYNVKTCYICYKQTYAKIYGWWKFETQRTERVLQMIKRMQRSAANFKSNTTKM